MNKFCFLQVSDNLLNPDDPNNPADVYFKAIWNHLNGEGYFKPEHYWEIPTWVAELSYCLKDHELELFHIDVISRDRHYPILPDADRYFGSIMDCNKEHFRVIAKNNPDKTFYFGGYIGFEEYRKVFKGLKNVRWYTSIEAFCGCLGTKYQYGTDYSLFKGMKCIPRLTLSSGCTNHCRFCTIPDEIIETSPMGIVRQIRSMRDLDFELVYINDKTFGQARNYPFLRGVYRLIKALNPKFRGFTIQTTCAQTERQEIDFHALRIVNVELGIESYNNEILRKYNKPQNTRSIDRAIDILKRWSVNIIPNIIIGLPGEDLYTYSETLKWIDDNKHRFLMLNVTNFVPYVGSDAFGIVKTQPKDLNQTVHKRSYHTNLETMAVQLFSELLFEIGMEILKATKARSIC